MVSSKQVDYGTCTYSKDSQFKKHAIQNLSLSKLQIRKHFGAIYIITYYWNRYRKPLKNWHQYFVGKK